MSSSGHRASHNHTIEPLQIEPFVPVLAPPMRALIVVPNKRTLRAALAMALALIVHATLIVVLLRSPTILTHDLLERRGEAAPPLLITLTIGEDDSEQAVAIAEPDLSVRALKEWTDETPPIVEVDDAGIDAATLEAPGGSAAQARYLAQIAARIERAWQAGSVSAKVLRPGRCDVWVTQLADGTVSSIEQVGCTARVLDASLLVTAVQRSSPLPAAPDDSLFVSALMISVDVEHGRVDVAPRATRDETTPDTRN